MTKNIINFVKCNHKKLLDKNITNQIPKYNLEKNKKSINTFVLYPPHMTDARYDIVSWKK